MFVTSEILRKHKACEQGIRYIERFYPNGAEMIDIIHDRHISKEFLHWGRKCLTHSEEELKAYRIACRIENTEGYWYSQDVRDSKYIIKSKDVATSIGVFESSDVVDSMDIVSSENIMNCKQVFSSSMIDESEKIFKGQNISNSKNICLSTMVVNSRSVIGSYDVFDSSEIINCVNISESYFCQDCRNIKHCMFCEGLENVEYYIFNHPVDKRHYEVFEKQYLKYLTELLDFIRDWPEDILAVANIAPTRKFDDWYHDISPKFWKWARTLPGYDSMMLYRITMLPSLLIEE